MKKSAFLRGAGVLALGTLFAKIIGAFYRIPLTNVLGAEGMGLYQLVFPVYSLILMTSSGALPTAISIMVSSARARGEEAKTKRLLSSAMTFMALVGFLGMLAVAALSYPLGLLQRNTEITFGYLVIAPAVFLVSGISVLRGWYQGHRNMAPTAVSNLVEAIGKLSVGLALAYVLKNYGRLWGVVGALIGVTVSEALTLAVMYLRFKREGGKLTFVRLKDAKEDYKELWKLALPITLGSVILPVTQFADSIIVVNLLSKFGNTVAVATADYGLFAGPVSTLINLPVVVGLSLSAALVPHMAQSKEERRINVIRTKSETALKLAIVIGVPFAILFLALAEGIIRFLYPALDGREIGIAANLLRIGSVSVVALLLQQIVASLMQGLGDSVRPTKHLAFAAAVKIGLDVVLLPFLGIYGVQIASAVAFTLAAAMNLYSFFNLQGKSEGFVKNSGVILVAGVIMCVGILSVSLAWKSVWGTILAAAIGFLLYFIALLFLGVMNEDELLCLPFGNKIYRLSLKLRFWEKKHD